MSWVDEQIVAAAIGKGNIMKVFISYGRADALEFAHKLSTWLKKEGFQPWLDVDEGIPIGAPFDVRIELGIEDSDILIAVLSPWSLRPEGFCRNELLFAQAKKRPIVPVRIADIIPPIQIISLNYVDACENPDSVLPKLGEVIRKVAREGGMPLREWPAATTGMPWWADNQRLTFEEELARHGQSFTGREWLFEQLRQWITNTNARLMLITADAGFGKSALAAQLTTRLNVRGVHFCSRSQIESCRPAAWLAGLVYQLAAQFPAYREKIATMPSPDWNDPGESLFRMLVAKPLCEIQRSLPIDEPWVFVVDALDESVTEAGFALADLLADSAGRIPEWLRIIVTCRPDQQIVARFKLDGIINKHLDAEGQPNIEDLLRYARERVARLEGENRIPQRSGSADHISELADGNFLFAKLTLDSLSDPDPDCRLRLEDIGTLPAKLRGLYHAMFRKRFRNAKAYEREVLPLLDCLVAARDPLPKDLLQSASGLDAHAFLRGMCALSQFLNNESSGYRVFHQSLAEWLKIPEACAEFAAAATTGCERLRNACLVEFQNNAENISSYTLRHLPIHLTEAGHWEELENLLSNHHWIRAQCLKGSVYDIVRDLLTLVTKSCSVDRVVESLMEVFKEIITEPLKQQFRSALNRFFGKYSLWPSVLREKLEQSDNSKILVFLGETYDMEEQFDKSETVFGKLLERTGASNPNLYATVCSRLAFVLEHQKRYQEALEITQTFNKAPDIKKKCEPRHYWWVQYQQAVCLLRLYRFDDATDLLEMIFRFDTHSGHGISALHQLGVIDQELGRLAQAEEKYQQCFIERGKMGWDHRRAYEHRRLGEVYALTNRNEQAYAEFGIALSISNECGHRNYATRVQENRIVYLDIPGTLENEMPEIIILAQLAMRFNTKISSLAPAFRVLWKRKIGYLPEISSKTGKPTGRAIRWDIAHSEKNTGMPQ